MAEDAPVITAGEVAVLNAARVVIRELSKTHSAKAGRLAEACDAADHAVFNVLNVSNAYFNASLTDEQLYLRALPVPQS